MVYKDAGIPTNGSSRALLRTFTRRIYPRSSGKVWRAGCAGGGQLLSPVFDSHFDLSAQSGACAASGADRQSMPRRCIFGGYVIVVDDDIDAYDINDVLWARRSGRGRSAGAACLEAQGK
jgi:3-octaprenyl-4-hydroxybenzoate carboxy-lyase C-terminal domain